METEAKSTDLSASAQILVSVVTHAVPTSPRRTSPAILFGTWSWHYILTKRLMDVSISLALLLLLIPFLLILATAVLVVDGWPILHRREVVGHHGYRFLAFKFRTMVADADALLQKQPGSWLAFSEGMKLQRDPRVTRLGRLLRRTSLDELPQLWNVLVGQMSLVGPRMIHQSELHRYGDFAYVRVTVKPGITGMWQVHGHALRDYAERIEYDRQYIQQACLWIDLGILARTAWVLIKGRGAV